MRQCRTVISEGGKAREVSPKLPSYVWSVSSHRVESGNPGWAGRSFWAGGARRRKFSSWSRVPWCRELSRERTARVLPSLKRSGGQCMHVTRVPEARESLPWGSTAPTRLCSRKPEHSPSSLNTPVTLTSVFRRPLPQSWEKTSLNQRLLWSYKKISK